MGRLWAGTEESLQRVLSVQVPDGKKAFWDDEDDDEDDVDTPSRLLQRVGGVGVVHVNGPLLKQSSWLSRLFGAVGYDELRKALVQAAEDPEVETILLSMDTPGGAVSGLSDVSDLVTTIDRNIKPVLAHTSGMMASAGYHIGSSARRISASKMADVGSIGVLQIHREASKLEERMGITTTVVRSGEFKAMGNPYEPLSEKAQQEIQASCDYSYDLFVRHVAEARGVSPETVRMNMAEGRVFTGEQARAVNLVDEISTFDEALQFAAEFGGGELHKSESLPQYGSNNKGLPHMKSATLTPLMVAAKKAMDEAAAQEAAALAATEAATAEAVETPTETPDDAPEATEAAVLEAPEAPTALAVLQEQLATAQEQLLDARIELRDAAKSLEASKKSAQGLRAVVEQSVRYLRVALNHAASNDSDLSDVELLAEHTRLQAQFDTNFKAGGVAAVSAQADEAQEETVDPVRKARLKAARLTRK
jgi:signal peptide peptidase SppA